MLDTCRSSSLLANMLSEWSSVSLSTRRSSERTRTSSTTRGRWSATSGASKTAAADLIFAPDVATLYPFGLDKATTVSVPGLTENFCGATRPGHFDGVTTVVARLFAMVQPDVAVFGQKDYQQQLVIRHMAEDLSLPITIITGETVRDDDGLAMSSRNSYLRDEERAVAPVLYETI